MGLLDCLIIVAVSIGSNLISEAISWLLIYRTEEYKSLKEKLELNQIELDKKKEKYRSKNTVFTQSQKLAISKLNEIKKALNSKLTWSNMKSGFFVTLIMIVLYGLLDSRFDGVVIAYLPFEPIPLIRSISHRNLIGNDFYQCSMTFFYVLCSFGIRTLIADVRKGFLAIVLIQE
eukprot:TRINITY_DN10661_c0_g1_i2.p1 TRINITY_DN10661_c0_g1~~TRINITY_DN10661_c0_g1_i2.p1  ORF type:complete len:175 (-),score=26.06 TRINITY_DN10661_c0_g1_i2:86-610(-)